MKAAFRAVLPPIAALVPLLSVYGAIFLPYLPNASGALGADYALWLPDLLVGYYWHLNNGWFSLPWFNPAQCGGVPFYADPQVPYLSVPQFLTFIMPPVEAVQTSFMLFAAFGFLGTFYLAKASFRLSASAATLAGAVFLFNEFYAARMLVGHMTYQPFMLTPALAASVLLQPGKRRLWTASLVACCFGGVMVTAMIQGGAVHVVPPALLSIGVLAVIHALRFGPLLPAVCRLAAAAAIGSALSAGKLAASSAFVANFPRDQYSLPGIDGLVTTIWRAAQALFLGPPARPEAAAVNSLWVLGRHEWEYGITIVPFLLMLLWLDRSVGKPRYPTRPRLWAAMVLLLATLIALNWYQPDWNASLKSLPFLGNSSNLLRWFAAYILPASLGGALAMDCVVSDRVRPAIAAAGIAGVLGINALADRSYYGANGQGTYRVATIEDAWRSARQSHTGPRITSMRVPVDQAGQVVLLPNRQDALALGYSQLLCYEPLFGYRLEHFPIGALHPGPALASSAGMLNVKNPACYLFPGANACAPGDAFPVARAADASAFLDYGAFPFGKPLWAVLSDWLGVATALMLGLTGLSVLARRRVQLVRSYVGRFRHALSA